jgi:hypothetical protein
MKRTVIRDPDALARAFRTARMIPKALGKPPHRVITLVRYKPFGNGSACFDFWGSGHDLDRRTCQSY